MYHKEDLLEWDQHLRKDLVTQKNLANIRVFLSWPEFTAEIGIDPGCTLPPYIEKLIRQAGSRIRDYKRPEDELDLYHEIHVKIMEKGSGRSSWKATLPIRERDLFCWIRRMFRKRMICFLIANG